MSGPYLGGDAERAIANALLRAGAMAGIGLTVIEAESRPWESATFSGARHKLTIGLDGDRSAIARWLASLPDREFALGRHIVADIAVERHEGDSATIEALTVANA